MSPINAKESTQTKTQRAFSGMPSLLVSLLLALLSTSMATAIHPVYRSELDGPALRGYDTVAYFRDGKPMQGSALYQTEWMGTDWFFKSAENRALFIADPEKYAPQFGGYCAYALSHNRLYEGDPEVFRIIDDKLYLNNNTGAESHWLRETDSLLEVARDAWRVYLDRDPAKQQAPAANAP